MELNTVRIRQLLKAFDFRLLFIEELGWDHHDARLDIILDGRVISLEALAQKRGMVAYICFTPPGERLPNHGVRRKIEHQAAKTAHEHLIIFVDPDQTTQVWQWVRRAPGKPIACRNTRSTRPSPETPLSRNFRPSPFRFKRKKPSPSSMSPAAPGPGLT